MNNLILITVLIVVYSALAIANFGLNFLTHFPTTQSEPKPISSGSNLTLVLGSIGIFCIWLGLSYLNSGFVGFYSLLFFYGLIALSRDIERPWFVFWMAMSIAIPILWTTIWQSFNQHS